MSSDPIRRFRQWYRAAAAAGVPMYDAMALATADARGRPDVRYVLLKGVDQKGFVFYTNTLSRKGAELAENRRAALAFYWDPLGKQVRIEGRVQPVSPAEADVYWKSRPRGSQLAGAVSQQSRPIASHKQLLVRWRVLSEQCEGADVPRPPAWSGYRVLPERIEFWTRGEFRLHHREEFRRRGQEWVMRLLQP